LTQICIATNDTKSRRRRTEGRKGIRISGNQEAGNQNIGVSGEWDIRVSGNQESRGLEVQSLKLKVPAAPPCVGRRGGRQSHSVKFKIDG